MYQLNKTEAQYLKHQLQAHDGKSNVNCPFCRSYKKKIGDNWKRLISK